MASQVYFVKADAVNLIKIGRSNDAERRFAELRLISPVPLTVLGVIPGGAEKEAELHRRFAALRSHGEWFFAAKELTTYVGYAAIQAAWDAASPQGKLLFLKYLQSQGWQIVIPDYLLAIEAESSDGMASGSEHYSADSVNPHGEPVAVAANMEPDDVDRSTERASSAVEVGAPVSPEGATRRLDDLGSVQDGLKMSTDGQPKTGLNTDCIERPIEAGVTAGETATGFQAKASEDNGATGQGADAELTDCMTGEVSRVDAGRTASATSDRMDATAGETATNSPSAAPAETGEAPSPHPASPVTPINPNCAHPETCKWARSMASCSACANAAAKARAA